MRRSLFSICQLFGISRQAYYQYEMRQDEQSFEEHIVLQLIRAIRTKHRYMGVRKIYESIKDDLLANGIKIGRDSIFELMWRNQLLVRRRRRYKRTTDSAHGLKVYGNLVKNQEINKPNQLWVSDITFIPTATNSFYYLSLVTDAHSKKILGHELSANLKTFGPLTALSMAINTIDSTTGLIHHSDRGTQYASHDYTQILKQNGIQISMTKGGEPTENAIAERVNGIIKTEYLQGIAITGLEMAKELIKQSIDLYNNERPHMSCSMLTPTEAHKGEQPLQRLWKGKLKNITYKSTT